MTVTKSEIRPGAYYDSVVLMQLQRALAALPGVDDAGVVMGTPANKELLEQSDLLPKESSNAGVDDLLIVVRADDEAIASDALSQIDELMASRRSSTSQTFTPRSLDGAIKMKPDARWLHVSVPGQYAAGVTRDALGKGLNVFLYSDNVSVEDEVELKKSAREKGLIVMGPDCGTAIINGMGFGFANHVRRGNIGLVGASGTGLQAVTVGIHRRGGGVSHALGTGGRDLKESVGALTAHQGLDLLIRDPETQVIVLVSKPPSPGVAAQLLNVAQSAGKPVVVNFIGYAAPARTLGNLHFALNLDDAAALAVELAETDDTAKTTDSIVKGERRYLRGLFSGGTLAYEALRGLQVFLSPLYSNVPVDESQRIADPLVSQSHTLLDLGEDVFTVGRLHPMMDNDLRIRRMKQEATDPEVALILLDVVLGEGAHADPASKLAPMIADLRKEYDVEFVVILVGTDEDPQEIETQREALAEAGGIIFDETLEAVAYIGGRLSIVVPDEGTPVALENLNAPASVINIGIETFYDSLHGQDVDVVHVDWRPPAGGNEKLMDILARMKGK